MDWQEAAHAGAASRLSESVCQPSRVNCIRTANRPGRPVFAWQESDFDVFNEAPRKERIEVAHASLVKIEHTAGFKRPNIVDLDNELSVAALDQCKGRLIKFAIPNTRN